MTLAEKSISGEVPDREVAEAVLKRVVDGKLPCAVAFDIARERGVARSVVGACADHLKIKLSKCRLGLFGHGPEKKTAKVSEDVCAALEGDIRAALADNGALPCVGAFEIAERTGRGRMEVSGVCDALGIRIKPCQLGAF